MKTAKAVIQDTWLKISDESAVYQDTWPCNESALRAIRACYLSLPTNVALNRKSVNVILTALSGSFDNTNIKGIYQKKFTTSCPYKGKKQKVTNYYRMVTNTPPSPPMQASDVGDIIARSTRMFLDRERISAAEQKKRS